jgi:hypothetical protein
MLACCGLTAAAAAVAFQCCCLQEYVVLNPEGKNWGAFKPMLADALSINRIHLLAATAAAAVAFRCCCLQEDVRLNVEGNNRGTYKSMLADAFTCWLHLLLLLLCSWLLLGGGGVLLNVEGNYWGACEPMLADALSINRIHLLAATAASAVACQCCCLQEDVLLDIEGKNWGAFKPMLADALIAHLEPIQSKYQAIMADPSHVDAVLDKGAAAAAETANATLNLVKDAMGFVVPKRVY